MPPLREVVAEHSAAEDNSLGEDMEGEGDRRRGALAEAAVRHQTWADSHNLDVEDP